MGWFCNSVNSDAACVVPSFEDTTLFPLLIVPMNSFRCQVAAIVHASHVPSGKGVSTDRCRCC